MARKLLCKNLGMMTKQELGFCTTSRLTLACMNLEVIPWKYYLQAPMAVMFIFGRIYLRILEI